MVGRQKPHESATMVFRPSPADQDKTAHSGGMTGAPIGQNIANVREIATLAGKPGRSICGKNRSLDGRKGRKMRTNAVFGRYGMKARRNPAGVLLSLWPMVGTIEVNTQNPQVLGVWLGAYRHRSLGVE
jgi:hypothetical protein